MSEFIGIKGYKYELFLRYEETREFLQVDTLMDLSFTIL